MNIICWLRHPGLFVLAAITLVACGGGGGGRGPPPATPPVISGLSFMPTSVPQGSSTVAVNGTLTFTDSGGDLATLEITVLDSSGKQVSSTSAPVQGASGKTSGTIAGMIQVAATTPGIFTLQVSVTDAGGSKSNVLSATFQVIPVSSMAAVVATTGANPQSLVLANGTLYWSESGEDALKSAPVTGATATVLATKMLNPSGMAFSGSDTVWLDDRIFSAGVCGATNINRVLKRTLSSGTTAVLDSGPACRGGATDVVVIGSTAYWVSSTVTPDTWFIHAVPLSGGAAATVRTSTTPIVALTSNRGTLYWMENFFPAVPATIYSMVSGSPVITTVASGFAADANTFAVDNASVYYATANFPPTNPPTETLWAQSLLGGSPQTLNSSIATPVKLLSTLNVAGSSVVWLDASAVDSVPTTGGTVTHLAAISGQPVDVLFDGANVIWSEITGSLQPGEHGVIRGVPLSGGAVTVLHQGGDAPRQLARDPSARLTWTEGGSVGMAEGFARIARIGLTGSEQTVVAGITSDSAKLAAGPSSLLIADQWRIKSLALSGGMPSTLAAALGGVVGGLTTDGTSIYWDDITSEVSKAPLSGGPITVLVASSAMGNAGPGGPIRIAPNGTLFWAAVSGMPPMNSSNVLSAPSAAPSTSVTVVAQGLSGLSDLAVDSSNVYVAESNPFGQIIKMPAAGGSATTLAPAGSTIGQLTLAGSSLYWLSPAGISKVSTSGGSSTEVIQFDGGMPTSFALDSASVYFTDAQRLDIRKAPN